MKLKVILEPSDEGGFTVYVPSLPGCISEGNTLEEAMQNIREAIDPLSGRVDRQKGSHIRLSKVAEGRMRKLTIPAHRPVKRSTLAKIIKQANLTIDEFLRLL